MMFHEELRKSLDEMNCTQKELADSYGIKQSSVANRIDVIRKKLKK